jgi:hypothetical protein
MTFLRTDYSFTTQGLVNAIDRSLDYVAERAVIHFDVMESRWSVIQKNTPALNNDHARIHSVEQAVRKVLTELEFSYLVQSTPALQAEVHRIEHLMDTGIDHSPSKLGKYWNKAYALYAKIRGTAQPITHQQVQDARTGLKALLTSLTPDQVQSLKHQICTSFRVYPFIDNSETYHWINVAKYNIYALAYNLATVNMISAVALAFFGLMSIKTTLIAVVACYAVRHFADQAMSLSHYEKALTIPIAVRIPLASRIPFIGRYLTNMATVTSISIPTVTGVKQLIARAHNYISNYGYSKMFDITLHGMINQADANARADMGRIDLRTPAGRDSLWNVIQHYLPVVNRVLPSHVTAWKSNMLVINDVVIFKNFSAPISLGFEMAWKWYKGELRDL